MSKTKRTVKDYERLGRLLADVYETGHIDTGRVYRMSFIKGVLSGFGGVIGATVVLSLLLWILTQFSDLWLIGDFVKLIKNTITSSL